MELNFKSFGAGPALVICHGLFGMLDNWQTLGKKWAEHYTVYLVDLRNHGHSPHASEFNYALMAEDLQEFLESQGIHKAHFLGHSMGGKAVMQLALTESDLVDKLIVVDMGVEENTASHQSIFEAMLTLPVDTIKSRGDAEDHLKQYIEWPGVRLFLMKNLSRIPKGGFRWKMNLKALHESYAEILVPMPEEVFEGSTLFVRGNKSNYLPSALNEAYLSRFPNAQQEGLDAGHWVHAEKPNELLSLVNRFLDLP